MVSTSLLCAAALLSAALGSLVPPPLSRRALFAAAAGLPALTQLPASALAAGGALSEDAVKQLISQIPLFAVTNKASQPYLTDASEDGIRTGFFFLDPKEALDELRNVRSAADPRARTPTHPAARGCFEETNNGRHPGGGDGVKCVSSRTDCTARDHSSPTDRGGRATRARAPHARAPTPPSAGPLAGEGLRRQGEPLGRATRLDLVHRHPQIRRRGEGDGEGRRAAEGRHLRRPPPLHDQTDRERGGRRRRGEARRGGRAGRRTAVLRGVLTTGGGGKRAAALLLPRRRPDGPWAQAEFARSADRAAASSASPRFRLLLLQEGGAPPGEASALFVALRRAVRGRAHRWDAGERGADGRRRRRRRRKPRGGRRRGGRQRTRRVGARSRRGARASGADGAVGHGGEHPVRLL